MDDFDIYGDLDNFDRKVQQSRTNECYDELQAKYNTLLNEKNRLESQNKKYKESIENLRANFQSLLDTAKKEINRKDTQIIELRKERDSIVFRRKPAEQNHSKPPSTREERPVVSSVQPVIRKEHLQPSSVTDRRRPDDREAPNRERKRSRDRMAPSRDGRISERSHGIDRRSRSREKTERSPARNENHRSDQKVRAKDEPMSKRSRFESSPNRPSAFFNKPTALAVGVHNEMKEEHSFVPNSTGKSTHEPETPAKQPKTITDTTLVPPPPIIRDPSTVPVPTEPSPKSEPPLLTSFVGSLQRLEKEGVVINTERATGFQRITTPPPAPPATIARDQGTESPCSNKTCVSSQSSSQEHISEEIPENTLQISAEIDSKRSVSGSTDHQSEASRTPPAEKTSHVEAQKPTLHPHMCAEPAQGHLPLMIIPREAVAQPKTENPKVSPLKDRPRSSKAPPTTKVAPKPKIKTKSAIRYPGHGVPTQAKADSLLTVENLKQINAEQQEGELEFLKAEMQKLGGMGLFGDAHLIRSFLDKALERQNKIKRTPSVITDLVSRPNPNVDVVNFPKQETVLHEGINNHDSEKPLGIATVFVRSPQARLPGQIHPQPATTQKCLVMGNTRYNYTTEDGKQVLVVSRRRKKKAAVVKTEF